MRLTKNLSKAPSELQHQERRPRYSCAVFRSMREEGSNGVSSSTEHKHTQLCQQHWNILRLSLHWNAVIFLYSYHHHPHLWCAASACSQRLPLPVWWVGTAESMAAVMRNEPLWGQVRPCCWLSTREWTHKQQVKMRLLQLTIAPVFGVTWSFRNQSNMLLKKHLLLLWSYSNKHAAMNPHGPVWGCWRGAGGLWIVGCDWAAQACPWCSFRCPSAGRWWWTHTPPLQRGCWVMQSSSAVWPHWETLQMSRGRSCSLSAAAASSGERKTKMDEGSTG